ncbi:MAG: hypothetical protein ACXVRK_07340 [Gaiellaceae bacterium]
MKRVLLPTVAVGIVALLVLATVALGKTNKRTTQPTLISIPNLVSGQMTGGTFKGRFKMLLDGVLKDSGTSVIRPNQQGALRIVGGQTQVPVSGQNNLTSSKGTLSFSLTGVSISIPNVDATKRAFGVEYGTWKITSGSGIYKGWKGGGRWANASTPDGAQYIDWAGSVTH